LEFQDYVGYRNPTYKEFWYHVGRVSIRAYQLFVMGMRAKYELIFALCVCAPCGNKCLKNDLIVEK